MSEKSGREWLEAAALVALCPLVLCMIGACIVSLNVNSGPASGAKKRKAEADLAALARAAREFRGDVGGWPTKLDDLGRCNAAGWRGPYILGWSQFSPVRDDPWHRAYIVRPLASARGVEILTYGFDGKPGGEGEDADIALTEEDRVTAVIRFCDSPVGTGLWPARGPLRRSVAPIIQEDHPLQWAAP